jgi:hypothetical protein
MCPSQRIRSARTSHRQYVGSPGCGTLPHPPDRRLTRARHRRARSLRCPEPQPPAASRRPDGSPARTRALAGRRRITALRCAMRRTPTARVMVTTTGRPSGIAETASATATSFPVVLGMVIDRARVQRLVFSRSSSPSRRSRSASSEAKEFPLTSARGRVSGRSPRLRCAVARERAPTAQPRRRARRPRARPPSPRRRAPPLRKRAR